MAKHRILGIIPVKESTWWKWQIAKQRASEIGIPMFIGATIGAAWCGYANMFRNEKQHRQIAGAIDDLAAASGDQLVCYRHQEARISELERQNALLLERALRETEGKT